jgi:hypothetical protein
VVSTQVAGSDDCGGEISVCHEGQDNTVAAGVQFFGGLDRKPAYLASFRGEAGNVE